MPIPELNNFRLKFPQYNDMDDLTLATKLAEKYPEYNDLLDKAKLEKKDTQPKATIYSEVVAPILEGGSTFAGGIPRLVAKAQGDMAEKLTFPEQQTIPGKVWRGVNEAVGFTAGLPGKAALFTGRAVGKGISMLPKFTGKSILSKAVPGALGGAAGMAVAGDTLKDRKEKAIAGAVLGGVASSAIPLTKASFNKVGQLLSTIEGVEKEIFQEAQKRGFRNVLQTKFYNKELPAQIQDRIAQNLDNIEIAAGNKYEALTQPLKNEPFDMAKFRGDVVKIANRIKTNPFDTDVSKLDNAILDGVINKAQIKNMGQALELRRSLDDIIYSNKGELKSSFGKQVRDLLNQSLHKNKALENVDKEWTSFSETIRNTKKILGDTGEKILERFGNLTKKQKQMLVEIEREIGGLPFVEDLTNYSLARKYITKSVSPTITGVVRAVTKPALRGFLRQGERFTGGLQKIEDKAIQELQKL
jgi:hypothetical protein